MRSGTGRLPLAVFSQLANFALDDVALEHAEMSDEENAVEVIDFVAKGARKETLAAHFKFFTRRIVSMHSDILRARHVAAETRHRKAAFLFALFALGVNDLRIRANDFRLGIFAV